MSSAESGSEASNDDIEVENDSMEEISTAEQANPNPLDAVIPTQENQEDKEIKESKENDIDQQPAVIEEKEEKEEKVEEKEPEQTPEPVIKPIVPVVPVQKVVKQPSIEYEEHPIVKIERHERDITAKIGDEVNLDEQFVISNHKSPDSMEKVPHIDTKILDVITKTCYPAESERAKVQNGEDWGHPRCLAVVPEKHIAIGTSKGVILIFNTDFTRIQKFGTSKERDFGAVVTLDIALKNDDVIAGYENGTMVLWSMTKNERLKTINPPDKSSLLCIRYFRDSEHFLLSTSNGVVYHYHVQWIILQFRVDKKPLNLQEVDDKKGADKTLMRKETFESLPDGYFSILRLSKSLSKVRNANKNIIVALASMKEVLIISLAPFKVLYRHTRPVGISDIVTPCISWGTGAMPDNPNNTDPLLIYSWGKTIHMVQVMNIEPKRTAEEDVDDYWSDEEEDEPVEKIKVAGYFSVKEDVTLLDWISSGTILAYTALGEYLVLNSGGFKGAAVSSTIKVVNYNDVVVASLPFDEEIQYQVFNGTSKSGITQKNVVHYANTIRASTQDRQIYIMGKKKMLSLQHLDWQEYIDTLCRRNEWLDALSSCVSNYRNPSKAFASAITNPEERKKMVQRFSVDLAKRFVLSNQHPVKVYPVDPEQNKVWASVMVWVVDLMLATENYSALFSQIHRLMEDLYVREVFIESLEPFILRGRLKSLSNDAFKEIVKFYSEKGKLDVLQHLVINLSTKDIDMDNAIILCMQYNLLTALMYLCAHKDDPEGPDLLTPMASALGRYQRSVEENNPNQEYGLKFLWFLSMTLNARLFPDGLIPRKIWEHKVKDTIILLFEEYHLDLMLTIDAYISYEIFDLCFQSELASLIGSFNDSSIKLIGNWNDDRPKKEGSKEAMNEQLKNDINRFIAAIQNTLQGQILGLIYYCSKKKEAYYNHLYYYLANVTVNRSCKVPYGVMEETLMYLLQHSYQAPPWKPKYTTKGLNEQRSELILGLLKELEPQNLEEITALADSDDLIDVKTYLIGLNKEFDKAFDLYLNQPTEAGRMKVFNWLREIIPTITENSEAFEQLKKMLIAKLHDLVAINGEKTRDIMLGLGNDVEMEVIQYLENKPHLQLDYVKEVLAKREGRDLIPDELLILHIKLLCLNEPKQVLKEIRTYNYPLDPCLNLCKEYKVKDAMAYLYERTGRLTEALDIKLDIFKEFLEKKITNVKEKGSFFSRGLDDKFEDISYACNEYTHLGTIEIPKMWLSTLDKILEFYQSCIVESKPKEDSAGQVDYLQQAAAHEELSQTYIGYISSFIEEMSKSVPIEHILKRLKAFQGLKLGELKNAFLGMLKGHSYETNILTKAEGLLTLNNCRETEDIYAKSAEGIKIDSSKVLLKEDDAEKAVVFLCGHVHNQNNVEEGVCPICMETEGWKVQNMVKVHTTKGTILTRSSKTSVTKPGASPVSTGGSAKSPGKTPASVTIDARPSRTEESGKSESRERSSRSLRKKKTISKWGKAEVRGDCIDKMDRFDDWRTADTFDWNKPDPRPKYGYKVPIYHKTN